MTGGRASRATLTSLAQTCRPAVPSTRRSFIAMATGNPYKDCGAGEEGGAQEEGRNSDITVSIRRGQFTIYSRQGNSENVDESVLVLDVSICVCM